MTTISAQFRDINDQLYQINFTTAGEVPSLIKLSGSPFTTQMDSSGDIIYKPAKYQSATVGLLSYSEPNAGGYKHNTYEGLFSAEAHGTAVELLRVNGSTPEVVWTGYATPNTYTQNFNNYVDELDLECIDGLSTLQYYKYTDVMPIDGKTADDGNRKNIKSFLDIINTLVYACGCYKQFYVSSCLQLKKYDDSQLLSQLYVSECNFFNEKGNDDTDKDVAWTCQDVFEELCRFLGVTAVADGDSVYLVDYDSVKAATDFYYCYPVVAPDGNGFYTGTGTGVTLSNYKTINASDFSASNTSISVDNTYNKIVVKDSLNTYDYVMPDMFDDGGENITAVPSDGTNIVEYLKPNLIKMFSSALPEEAYLYGGSDNQDRGVFVCYFPATSNPTKDFSTVWIQYWNNSKWKFYQYCEGNYQTGGDLELQGCLGDDDHKSVKMSKTMETIGAYPIKSYVKSANDVDAASDNNTETSVVNYGSYLMLTWLNYRINGATIGTIDYGSYFDGSGRLQYLLYNSQKIDPRNQLMAESPDTAASDRYFIGGANQYLLITGNVYVQDREQNMFPLAKQYSTKGSRYEYGYIATLRVSLQCGDYYYSPYTYDSDGKVITDDNGGYVGVWSQSSEPIKFNLPFMPVDSKGNASTFFCTSLSIQSNVPWRSGINEEGFAIDLSTLPRNASGFKLRIYNPYPFTASYRLDSVLIQNLKVKAVTVNNEKDVDSDTEYSLVTSDDYVQELGDIEFKVCTWDNKKPNYSCVCTKSNNGTYSYVDRLYHNALCDDADLLASDLYKDGSQVDGSLRAESWLVYKCWKQYGAGRLKVDANLRNDIKPWSRCMSALFPNRVFIVDAASRDYRLDSSTYTLIEKQ